MGDPVEASEDDRIIRHALLSGHTPNTRHPKEGLKNCRACPLFRGNKVYCEILPRVQLTPELNWDRVDLIGVLRPPRRMLRKFISDKLLSSSIHE